MGLFRCPKCDAICHTDEEVCHLCGYRLKPVDESKVEEKPQEEKKEETKVSQKIEISSGFSRKSLFNSVSFDKKEETKKEEPKEDIFEDYFNKAFEENKIVEPEPVKEEKVEVKPADVDAVKPKAVEDIPIKKETVVDVTPVVVTKPKIEEPKVEVKPKVAEPPTIVESPKVEEKPKPTTGNPFANTGYKPASSTSTTTSTSPQNGRKKEPTWVSQWRYKVQKNKKTAKTWTIVLFILFILFIILVSTDKEITHSGWGETRERARPIWIFFTITSGLGFVGAIIALIFFGNAILYAKEVEGFYVVVYGYSNDYRLILENREVDRHYGSKSYYKNVIKLSGRLPNKKIVVASIFYQNYDRVIKIETLEGTKKK